MKKKQIIMATTLLAVIAAAAAIGWHTMKSPSASATADNAEATRPQPVGPAFNADSAYAYAQVQCDFGPRTMNSAAHDACGDWIVGKFKEFGCTVMSQKANLKGYDGTVLRAHNIIARFNPDKEKRILICAHWDSRPWADNDPDSANWRKPVVAANDGASGVAVMLELARLVAADSSLNYGIDFVCFDAEDWGPPQWADVEDAPDAWALGAQHFARHLPEGSRPAYGILLDMVGGEGAKFYIEQASKHYAPDIVERVWSAAADAGYGSFFPRQDGGYITDDHIPLNEHARIPTVDIIPFYPDFDGGSFGPTWHTINDTMEHIDRNTLKAVGQTVLQVLYTEQ